MATKHRRIILFFLSIQAYFMIQIESLSSCSSSKATTTTTTTSNNKLPLLREIHVDLSPHLPQPILALERQNLDNDDDNTTTNDDDDGGDFENDLLTQAIMDDNEETYHGILGAQAWPSGFVAAKYLLQSLNNNDDDDDDDVTMMNHVVLELACGTGIPSLAALASGKCKSVVATDLDVSLVTHAKSLMSTTTNDQQQHTKFQSIKLNLLHEKETTNIIKTIQPNIIVAADCLYDATLANAVGKIIGKACRLYKSTTKVIVSDPNRLEGRGRMIFLDAFLDELMKGGNDKHHDEEEDEEEEEMLEMKQKLNAWRKNKNGLFVDVHTPQERLKGAGASLSWCGVDETFVGVFQYPPPSYDDGSSQK